jgi:hypothetical protein
MDILNNIDLKGNNITSATLNNSAIGNNTTTTAGAIKYNSGSLSYYNGSSWVTLGSGSGTRVDGYFNVSDGTTTYSVKVTPESASRTISFTSFTEGTMNISMMDSSVSRTLTVPTTYIKTTGEINIVSEYSGGTEITITHGLGTYNIITQVWYKSGNNWEVVNADITATSSNVIKVSIGGNNRYYAGTYKVLIFRGYEQRIDAGNITLNNLGPSI